MPAGAAGIADAVGAGARPRARGVREELPRRVLPLLSRVLAPVMLHPVEKDAQQKAILSHGVFSKRWRTT